MMRKRLMKKLIAGKSSTVDKIGDAFKTAPAFKNVPNATGRVRASNMHPPNCYPHFNSHSKQNTNPNGFPLGLWLAPQSSF